MQQHVLGKNEGQQSDDKNTHHIPPV